MKTCFIRFLVLPLVGFGLMMSGPASGEDEGKKRQKTSERELERLRDSLHEAQRELAEKEERIETLERELEAAEKRATKKVEEKKEETRAESRKADTAAVVARKPGKAAPTPPKPGIPKVAVSRTRTAPAAQKAASFRVEYEARSAVNYEAREKALAWVRERLKENPGRKFRFTGRANDTEYKEVNVTVATNRARYLADYLRLSGVPETAVGPVSGTATTAQDAAGKSCEIAVIEPSGEGRKDS